MSAVWNTDDLWQAGETSWSISKHRVVTSWDSYGSKQHSVVPSQFSTFCYHYSRPQNIYDYAQISSTAWKSLWTYGLKCSATQTVWQ